MPDHVYRDEGVSGLRRERPGLDRLLAAVAHREVGVVLAVSQGRLARDQWALREILDECERVGCRMAFADDG